VKKVENKLKPENSGTFLHCLYPDNRQYQTGILYQEIW